MSSTSVKSRSLKVSSRDEDWGVVVTSVGTQRCSASAAYRPAIEQPTNINVATEYRLIYITKGSGYFSSLSCERTLIKAGSIILLFPSEWYSYQPTAESGWEEYWVGFRGDQIDRRIANRFFTPQKPIHNIGINASIIEMYRDILSYTNDENMGYQQMISGIVLNILGHIYYYESNNLSSRPDQEVVEKMNRAQQLMKESAHLAISPEQIAEQMSLGYTWFRRMFKRYTGISPAQYQTQQRMLLAKEMLSTTNLNINEIAYELNFKSGSQFATVFKKIESITPSAFREGARGVLN